MSSRRLTDLTWTELEAIRPIVAVPIGSCEQHGPHLPLDTDTRIAIRLATALSEQRADVLVGPALTVGASWEHAGFPGLLSIDHRLLSGSLVELARSADWTAGLVFVNGHGGNLAAVRTASATIASEGRRVLAWSPRLPGSDAHAGRTETSIMLAIDPAAVRSPLPADGHAGPWSDAMAVGVAAVSPNGVLGNATGAGADEGLELMSTLIADLLAAFDGWVR